MNYPYQASKLSAVDPLGLLDEISLGRAQGGKKITAPLVLDVVRSLTANDLPELLNPPSYGTTFQKPAQIRHSHHQIAQLLANGMELIPASQISGYSPKYISNMKTDPAFQELLAYYLKQREMVFVDMLERQRNLGIATLDELQSRLAEDPGGWSKRELMEMYKLLVVDGGGGSGPSSSAPGVTLNVKFVAAHQPSSHLSSVIDLEHEEVE